MPIDPDISLAAGRLPGGVQAPALANPLGLVGQYAETAQRLQQLNLFNQTLQARQRAGEIIAGSPDLETGIHSALQDPLVAGFAGDTLNAYRQSLLAVTQQQREQQTMSTSGFQGLLQGLTAAYNNPEGFNSIANAYLAQLSPTARDSASAGIASLKNYLLAPDTNGNPVTQDLYHQRMAGVLLGAGVSPETYRQGTGALAT